LIENRANETPPQSPLPGSVANRTTFLYMAYRMKRTTEPDEVNVEVEGKRLHQTRSGTEICLRSEKKAGFREVLKIKWN